jgi:hypothetical protein
VGEREGGIIVSVCGCRRPAKVRINVVLHQTHPENLPKSCLPPLGNKPTTRGRMESTTNISQTLFDGTIRPVLQEDGWPSFQLGAILLVGGFHAFLVQQLAPAQGGKAGLHQPNCRGRRIVPSVECEVIATSELLAFRNRVRCWNCPARMQQHFQLHRWQLVTSHHRATNQKTRI